MTAKTARFLRRQAVRSEQDRVAAGIIPERWEQMTAGQRHDAVDKAKKRAASALNAGPRRAGTA